MPLALVGLVQTGAFFFLTVFLAHVNENTLAAGALVSWLFGMLSVILFGTLSSINILVALKHGANDREGIALIARDGLWLALLLVVPAFFLFRNMSPIFLLFGQSPEITALAQTYLHALVWGLIPNFMMMAILEVVIGIGHTKIVMISTLFTAINNILFSFILVFGKFGFPNLGIAGAGWGATISYTLTLIFLVGYVFFSKKYSAYFSRVFDFHKPYFTWELLKVGVPIGVMYCFEVAFFFALTVTMGTISSKVLAANQVALQYLGLLMSMMFSVAQAVTVRMGHLLGAHQVEPAKKANYMGMGIAALLMIIVAVIYWVFPSTLISIDFNLHDAANVEVIHYIREFLMICAVFQIFEAVRITLFGGLRGLKDTKFTLFISILSFWGIAFPVGYLFAFYLGWGGAGFWIAMVLSVMVSVALLFWRFQNRIKKYINYPL